MERLIAAVERVFGRAAQGVERLNDLWRVLRKPGFFWILPGQNVQFWARTFVDVGPPAGPPNDIQYNIGQYRVPAGRVVIVTDYTFFAHRARAFDNDELMDSAELAGYYEAMGIYFDESPCADIGTLDATTITGRAAGEEYLNNTLQGIRPGMFAIAMPGTVISARFWKTGSPVTIQSRIGARAVGYTMPLSDFRRMLPEGSSL